jgi:hypothetical protein
VSEADRDRDLSALFQAERIADESAAPPLDSLLVAARRRRAGGVGALPRLALAASVAGVLAAAALVLRSPSRAASDETVSLAEWKSPTAFLLETPGSELLTEVPTLSVPPLSGGDGAAAPQPTKGAPR